MNNNYLHIEGNRWNWCDGVFSGVATVERDKIESYCLGWADEMCHSKLGNYDGLTKKQREELAKKWEAAKDLPDGEYDYYFNLEDKNEVFKKSVKALAKKLGIKYELKLK